MEHQIKPVWTEEFRVSWHESDRDKKAFPSTIFNYLMETAWLHAEYHNVGFAATQSKNLIWVLNGINIEMAEYPKWPETITIKTWSRGFEGIYAIREYQIFAGEKEIGRSSSKWLVIDKETRRPARPETLLETFAFIRNTEAMSRDVNKLDGVLEGDFLEEIYVPFNHLDHNGHVNSSRYLEWIMSYEDQEFMANHEAARFEMNFLAEAFHNETIDLMADRTSNLRKYEGVQNDEIKSIFRAEIDWRKRD